MNYKEALKVKEKYQGRDNVKDIIIIPSDANQRKEFINTLSTRNIFNPINPEQALIPYINNDLMVCSVDMEQFYKDGILFTKTLE